MRGAVLVVLCAGCEAELDQRLAIVREPRVLAVIAEPAEVKPGGLVTYSALLAGPDGTLAALPRWSYCTAPKPPTEDNAVSDGCLDDAHRLELGVATSVATMMPADACATFGPDTPPGDFRPRDADQTGGYYQPVRVDGDAPLAFGLSRVQCKLPTAPAELARRYDLEYVANANPTLDGFALDHVRANSDVELVASWPAAAVESYLYFDTLAQQLVMRREAMRVSWFATGGALAVDASAVGEAGDATRVATTWHAPGPGMATLWLVLRDSRGGIATATATVEVE